MTTQVSFTAEEELKNKALQKARQEGITLKAILVYSMKAFVDGNIHFGIMSKEEDDVEEIFFDDEAIKLRTKKLEALLK